MTGGSNGKEGSMPEIDMVVVRDGDPPPWADIADGYRYVPDAGWRVAVLEHGMQGGAPSVAIRIDPGGPGAGGQPLVFETSLDLWIAVTSAMRGAFPAAFAGGPLAVR